MISAKFLLGNVLLGGKLQIDAKNSKFDFFESALCMKSVSMPLTQFTKTLPRSRTPLKSAPVHPRTQCLLLDALFFTLCIELVMASTNMLPKLLPDANISLYTYT